MRRLLHGTLILISSLLCSCGEPEGAASGRTGTGNVDTAGEVVAKPEIRQILLVGERNGLEGGGRPSPITSKNPINCTVSTTKIDVGSQRLTMRLIDLSSGQVLGEQTQSMSAGQDTAHFEFKPVGAWARGRHLLEARLGPAGKVFQREFDVVP